MKPESNPPVDVNFEACRSLASLLCASDVPPDREDSSLPDLTPVQVGNYYLFLVSICHQTSPRGKPPLEGVIDGVRLRGWDYLTAKFERAVSSDDALLSPTRWASMTQADLVALFRDPTYGERLSDPTGRAKLVRNLGAIMGSRGWSLFQDLYDLCGGRVATESPNLLELLGGFRAYDDPVFKKSFFLLSVMKNTGLWTYPDDDRLGPPVDYHEVRGHLRIGTVVVRDEFLRQKLLDEVPVDPGEDVVIRDAVRRAIMVLSELTGFRNPSKLHYLFWNVFRACCRHDETHCLACPPGCSLPVRYIPLALHARGPRRCPFSEVCSSAGKTNKLFEHVFDTDYY